MQHIFRMTLATCLMFLMLSSISGVCSQTLAESEAVVKQHGESHKLTCTYAGISDDDAAISWIRQAEGKGLEWVAYISAPSGSIKAYSTSVQNRFTISRDNNMDQVYLQMNSLTTEDSAVYYCARNYGLVERYYFDYWGRGTEVTVSSGTVTAASPTLFPLVQCNSGPADKITVGCLARDFYPKSLTFQWTNASGTALTSVNYPPTEKNNKYTGVSLVQVSKSYWDSFKSINCSVTHPGGPNTVKVEKASFPPKVTLVSVPSEDTQALVCTSEGFLPKELSVKWKKNANSVTGFTNWAPQIIGGVYSAVSVLKVKNTDWDSKAVYTCEVTHRETTYTKKASKAPITVTLNQPSPKGIFSNNQAELECIITGQDEAIVNEIKVTWQIDGQDVTDNITETTKSVDGQRIKTSTMTRSRTEWQRVNKVRCSAIRDDMTPVIQDLTVHKGDGREPIVTVHVLPEEDINKGAEVTLVCLVSSPVLQDYYIAWSEENTNIYTDGINFPPQKTQQGYSVTSVYTTTKEKWDKYNMFNCHVWPAGSNDSMEPRGVSKSHDFPPESKLGFALSCTEDAIEEDEFSSLWSTTSSFIFLFISSLFYSMIFSLVKMKRR